MDKDENLNNRKELTRRLIDSPENVSLEMMRQLTHLMETRKIDERVQIVSEIMHVHPRTIWRHYFE